MSESSKPYVVDGILFWRRIAGIWIVSSAHDARTNFVLFKQILRRRGPFIFNANGVNSSENLEAQTISFFAQMSEHQSLADLGLCLINGTRKKRLTEMTEAVWCSIIHGSRVGGRSI